MNGWEKNLKDSFPRFEFVKLVNCQVDSKDSISKLFPSIQGLKILFYRDEMSLSFFDNPNYFPTLENLDITLKKCDEAIVPFLRLNSHLKSMTIVRFQGNLISEEFSNAFKTLENLEQCTFFMYNLTVDSSYEMYFKNVKKFIIKGSDTLKIPFSFGQLYELFLADDVELNDNFFKFIDKNPTIRNIAYFGIRTISVMDRLKIVKSLPSLQRFCRMYWPT